MPDKETMSASSQQVAREPFISWLPDNQYQLANDTCYYAEVVQSEMSSKLYREISVIGFTTYIRSKVLNCESREHPDVGLGMSRRVGEPADNALFSFLCRARSGH